MQKMLMATGLLVVGLQGLNVNAQTIDEKQIDAIKAQSAAPLTVADIRAAFVISCQKDPVCLQYNDIEGDKIVAKQQQAPRAPGAPASMRLMKQQGSAIKIDVTPPPQ